MKNKKFRNIFISIFVIVWTLVFHYESIRFFYLNPLFDKPLPKVKFLFPPAGWIMFYSVGNTYGHVQVYGVTDRGMVALDPHDINRVRTIGFDNIHRNILSGVANRRHARGFCQHLENRFPDFERFLVTSIYYPNITEKPYEQLQNILYRCGG